MKAGQVIWLTGISGSGKSTIGLRIVEQFKRSKLPAEFLDGDIVRDFFENDLGYSRNERILNIPRITFAAKLLSDHGINVVVANIAPYYVARDFIRRKLSNYIQIFCSTTLEKVAQRNVKGLYNQNGAVGPVIGVDDVYEIPRAPDLILNTDTEAEDESYMKLLDFLKGKNIL